MLEYGYICINEYIVMTIRELKNNILLALYERYKAGKRGTIEFDKLCSEHSIIYDSKQQLSDAVKSLKSSNYVNASFSIGDRGMIHNITPDGVQFVEDNLLTQDDLVVDGLKDTDILMNSGAIVDIDVDGDPPKNIPESTSNSETEQMAYTAKEQYKDVKDSTVEPCFGINALAECYVKQLDEIAEHTNENFRMLGIFGPWGRGKTYFFQKIKELIIERTNKKAGDKTSNDIKNGKEQIKYKIIEFNAWKYQDTPAIWAYLYETIYEDGFRWFEKGWFYIKYFFKQHWQQFIAAVVIYMFTWFFYSQITKIPNISDTVRSIMTDLKIPLIWFSGASGICYAFIKNPISIRKTIEKHFKRKSYKEMLGVQNYIEEDLEFLVKNIVRKPEKKQIILYVDDIDRCETEKMLSVVNSLRLILENKEIQKRMIVICSVDAKKLLDAYCKQKFGGDTFSDEQKKEAIQHLDKLFIFSIGLAPIDQYQQIEYLEKLYGEEKVQSVSTTSVPYSINREKKSIITVEDDNSLIELTDEELGKFLRRYLQENNTEELTPRKIRIIYYRLLFANNIMAHGQGLIKKDVLDEIIKMSISGGQPGLDMETAGSDVVSMVVPY